MKREDVIIRKGCCKCQSKVHFISILLEERLEQKPTDLVKDHPLELCAGGEHVEGGLALWVSQQRLGGHDHQRLPGQQ